MYKAFNVSTNCRSLSKHFMINNYENKYHCELINISLYDFVLCRVEVKMGTKKVIAMLPATMTMMTKMVN